MERSIRYIRDNFFAARVFAADVDDLNTPEAGHPAWRQRHQIDPGLKVPN
ncbi:MAG: hypothetical protein IPO19_22565 [Rhodoferax sp.]|nr:hypothetical protein [Rhodoferax sp.]